MLSPRNMFYIASYYEKVWLFESEIGYAKYPLAVVETKETKTAKEERTNSAYILEQKRSTQREGEKIQNKYDIYLYIP